jgi:hypothetical protein
MRYQIAAALVLVLAAVAPPPAGAIGLLEELGRLGLNNDDFAMAAEAAKGLYTSDNVQPGAHATWHNPETGARGEVEILESDGRCVMIKHLFRSGEQEPVRRVDVRRCRDADGSWKISG